MMAAAAAQILKARCIDPALLLSRSLAGMPSAAVLVPAAAAVASEIV
jgi:hypothetical protein